MRWHLAYKGSPVACALADRHYSTRERRARKPAKQVGAPGRLVVLTLGGATGYWISREQSPEACLHAWPGAWECSAFRNESPHRASELIDEALAATVAAWGPIPPAGFITMVNPLEVRTKKDPGHVFVIAGFREAGWTLAGHGRAAKRVLKLKPSRYPSPRPAIGAPLALDFEPCQEPAASPLVRSLDTDEDASS